MRQEATEWIIESTTKSRAIGYEGGIILTVSVALWAAVISAIAVVAAAILGKLIESILDRRRAAQHRSVTVAQIRDPGHADVFRALRLYERRIPAAQRDDLDDIVRWLREVQEESKRGVCKLEDYFLVARVGDDLAGFAYLQAYPSTSLAFFSYLVVDENVPEATFCKVSTELVRQARRLIVRSGRCRAVLIEVEKPASLRGPGAHKAAAQIRHFKALARMVGCPLKSLDIDYLQPRLSLEESGKAEVPMRLLYASLNAACEPRRLHKRDVTEILEHFTVECSVQSRSTGRAG